MAGPLGMSAAQIASQKLPEAAGQQAQQANKASPSKFDQALKAKGPDQAAQVGQVQHAESVQKANQVEHAGKVERAQKADEVAKNDRIRSEQSDGTGQSKHAPSQMDPVQQKTEVSKSQNSISGLFAGIEKGQASLDKLIEGATSGKSFSNTELLSLQAGMYKYSQELDLTSKVIEKATGGLKDTLKTQV